MTLDDFGSSLTYIPSHPNQILYYISLFDKIRLNLTYLPTLKSDVICGCSLKKKYPPNDHHEPQSGPNVFLSMENHSAICCSRSEVWGKMSALMSEGF